MHESGEVMTVSQKSPTPNPAQMYEEVLVTNLFRPLALEVLNVASPAPGDRVLDVACGTGIMLREAAVRVANLQRLAGVDINPMMIDVGRAVTEQAGIDVEWYEAPAESLPFAESEFSSAYCQQGLQFFPDKVAAMRETQRVLEPGGRAISVIWRQIEDHPFIGALNDVAYEHTGHNMLLDPFSFSDEDAIRDVHQQAGFADISIQPVSITYSSPSPKRDLRMMLMGATAAIRSLQELPPEERLELVNQVLDHADPVLDRYRDGDHLITDWHANLVIARKG